MSTNASTPLRTGDKVRLWMGPPKRGGWRYGRVVGIDTHTAPGVAIVLDPDGTPCYATHAEVELVARSDA